MDATTTPTAPALRVNRFLPYWAVLQSDAKQTLHSWLYRVWVLLSMGAAIGYLMYRFGAMQVSGMLQHAPETVGHLLQWIMFGSITLIIVLTAGTITAELGTMADSVLSRGISRHQYFLGKWHSRLAVVMTTFLAKSLVAIGGAFFLLHSDALTLHGSLVALAVVASLLVFVVTCGVSVSALSSNTVLSIAIVWLTLYGGGFLLSLLPGHLPTPDRVLNNLPAILRGHYDGAEIQRVVLGSFAASLAIAAIAMVGFSRKDV